MTGALHERKFEIDSSANVLRLQNGYIKETGD
jgi:meiotically up-regulated gene 157 (Mug157) protein